MALPSWFSAAPSCSGLAARGGHASRPRRAAATAAGLDPSPWGGLIGPATGGSENQGESCAVVAPKTREDIRRFAPEHTGHHPNFRVLSSSMLIDSVFPAVVGAKDMLLRRLMTAAGRHGLRTQIDEIVGPIPVPLLNARCFLDRMTKHWRYEFALPLYLDVTRKMLWGTHMWIPVSTLLGVLACAHARLPKPQYSDYCRQLANPNIMTL
jgi:hypothetical protein